MQYKVVRSSRRKTIALQVKNGQLVVRTPSFVSDEYIAQLVLSKKKWIENKLVQPLQTLQKTSFSDGGIVYWLGEPVVLKIMPAKKSLVCIEQSMMVVHLSRYWYSHTDIKKQQLKIKQLIEAYAKNRAQNYISEKVPFWANQTNLKPKSITVKKYRARWGSCNNKRELQFNYMLMMAPSWVFDYVIVHELCHLKHLNHSQNFWQLVSNHMPNYIEAKQWLKRHKAELSWD